MKTVVIDCSSPLWHFIKIFFPPLFMLKELINVCRSCHILQWGKQTLIYFIDVDSANFSQNGGIHEL